MALGGGAPVVSAASVTSASTKANETKATPAPAAKPNKPKKEKAPKKPQPVKVEVPPFYQMCIQVGQIVKVSRHPRFIPEDQMLNTRCLVISNLKRMIRVIL